MGERLELFYCELESVFFTWIREDKENTGERLDEALELLETLNPTLKKLIEETDADEMTDEEAMNLIGTYFRYNKMMKE